MAWTIRVSKRVQKAPQKITARDREQVVKAVSSMVENPVALKVQSHGGGVLATMSLPELNFDAYIVDVVT